MTHRHAIRFSLLIGLAAMASFGAGCSGPADSGFGYGLGNSGPPGSPAGSGSGSLADAGGSQANGGASGSSGGGGAMANGSSSGGSVGSSSSGSGTSSSSGGSGNGSGGLGSSSGGPSSGGSGGHADAGASQDATAPTDATMTPDTASGGGDAGLCDNASDWLTPMNQARAAVNAGEPPLVCDPIAAQVALNYANMCMWGHNMNRNSDYTALGGTGGLGENIAAGGMMTAAGAVNLWDGEEQYYDHSTNTCASGQTCGHYTQVVWKSTTAVGCAIANCTANSPVGGGPWQYAVCDFSPPGNYVGQPPY